MPPFVQWEVRSVARLEPVSEHPLGIEGQPVDSLHASDKNFHLIALDLNHAPIPESQLRPQTTGDNA